MSKRFGRNQRRRLREQVATLQVNQDALAARWLLAERENYSYRSQMERLRRALGANFVGFDVETVLHKLERNRERDRMRVHTPNGIANCQTMVMKTAKDGLTSHLHFRIECEAGGYAYVISENALRSTPEDLLIEQVKDYLAAGVVRAVRKSISDRRLYD